MPLPLKLFEISDVVLKDETKGECLHRISSENNYFILWVLRCLHVWIYCICTYSTFISNVMKVVCFIPVFTVASLSLPVSTNQTWVPGIAGVCVPFTTTRTRASRWSMACLTGPCSSWRWSLAGMATTSRRQTVRRADCSSGGNGEFVLHAGEPMNLCHASNWIVINWEEDCEMILIVRLIALLVERWEISAVLFSSCQICLWCGRIHP